ncbi:hypothetical protein LB505_000971 [Fusarium chuoi]|nr:hypothetical protein LB505_000971 [Fusarium chuoi]
MQPRSAPIPPASQNKGHPSGKESKDDGTSPKVSPKLPRWSSGVWTRTWRVSSVQTKAQPPSSAEFPTLSDMGAPTAWSHPTSYPTELAMPEALARLRERHSRLAGHGHQLPTIIMHRRSAARCLWRQATTLRFLSGNYGTLSSELRSSRGSLLLRRISRALTRSWSKSERQFPFSTPRLRL